MCSSIPTRVRNTINLANTSIKRRVPAYLRGFETVMSPRLPYSSPRVPAYLRGFETWKRLRKDFSEKAFQHTYEGSKLPHDECVYVDTDPFQHTYEGSKPGEFWGHSWYEQCSSIPTRVRNLWIGSFLIASTIVPAYLRGFETKRGGWRGYGRGKFQHTYEGSKLVIKCYLNGFG